MTEQRNAFLEPEERAELESEVAQRLSALDDETLRQLARALEAGRDADGLRENSGDGAYTRRQVLAGTAAGTFLLVSSNLGTGFVAMGLGEKKGEIQTRAAMALEIAKLRGLLALYEGLERVHLDDLVVAAIDGMGTALRAVRRGTRLVRRGVELVEDGVDAAERGLGRIREEMRGVERLLDSVELQLARLEGLIAEATGRAEPVGEALLSFLESLLDRIPFGVGERIEETIRHIAQFFGSVPELLSATRERLLDPLHEEWFAGDGLEATLVASLRQDLVDPLMNLLDDVDTLAARWEQEFVGPADTALSERQSIRAEIRRYKEEHEIT